MHDDLIALPFHAPHMFYNVHGLLRLEPGRLVIECEPIENVFGFFRGNLRRVEIPVGDLAEVSLSKGKFGITHLCLRTYSLQSLRRFPGALEGVCQLRVRRSHALLAADLASRLELMISEESLRRLQQPADAPPLLPPPETKVEHLLKVWDGIKGLLK